jgi:hypothetical protein
MLRNIRWIAVLAVLAFLTVGTAQAWPVAPKPTLTTPTDEVGLLEGTWKWLTELFHRPQPKPAKRVPPAYPEKEGCQVDPNGRSNCSN